MTEEYEMSAKERRKLKKFVERLTSIRGRNTELVSVYVPAGYDLNNIVNHLREEQSTANNIKSKQTRENVTSALERMIRHLQLYDKTPENGLAVFSGNVAEREGEQDVEVWSVEPPIPVSQRLYRCDKEFVTEPLEKMVENRNVYGMIVIDKREADLALLKGKTIIPLTKSTSNVPGKTRAGGQSAQRFARLREGAAKDFYRRVTEKVKKSFLGREDLKGILLGGPGQTKIEYLSKGDVPEEIKQKVIAKKDLSYTGQFGLEELLEKCEDVLAKEEVVEEKQLMKEFLQKLSSEPAMVDYGEEHVMKTLKMGAVETLLLSEELDDESIDAFEREAKKMSSTVKLISTDTREGKQLVDLGKVAALLRYAANF
jgi:peptide chain release factor subunit 1